MRLTHLPRPTTPLAPLYKLLTTRIIIFWWTNAFNTSYLPINSNRTFDNTGKKYKVAKVLDDRGQLDFAKYNQYSEPWMGAGNLVVYFWFFASVSPDPTSRAVAAGSMEHRPSDDPYISLHSFHGTR